MRDAELHRRQLRNFVWLAEGLGELPEGRMAAIAYSRWYLLGGRRRPTTLPISSPRPKILSETLVRALRAQPEVDTERALWQSQPGFFTFDLGQERPMDSVRVYARGGTGAIIKLLGDLVETSLVSDARPAGKVRLGPAFASAADVLVLYVPECDLDLTFTVLRRHERYLMGPTPPMTVQLHPGVALAPDCGGESWGRVVCTALESAWGEGCRSPMSLADRCQHHMPRHSELDAIDLRSRWSRATQVPATGPTRRTRATAHDAAVTALHHLVDTAVWDGNACAWLTPVPGCQHSVRMTGPDLYSGTAGIALALATGGELFDDEAMRRTGRGASAWTLRHLGTIDPSWSYGMLSGRVGALRALELACPSPWLTATTAGGNELGKVSSRTHFDLATGVVGLVFSTDHGTTMPIRDALRRRLLAVETRQLGLVHGSLGVVAALAALGLTSDADARLGQLDLGLAASPVGRLLLQGRTTWCRGVGGLITVDDLVGRSGGGTRLPQHVRVAAASVLEARVGRCFAQLEAPGSLCHGALGDLAVDWFHRDGNLLEAALAGPSDGWFEHHYRDEPPGLMTGIAGFAHLLVDVARSRDTSRRQAHTPLGLLG